MRIHFLGTTGYHPNELRHTACLMIPELGLVFDAGTGFFRTRELLVLDELSVFLTHGHLDHSIGLTYLWDVLCGRTGARATVYAEPQVIAAVREHLLAPQLFPVSPPATFVPLKTPGRLEIQGARLTHFPLRHPGGTLGFRLDAVGKSMAYVTDTTAAPNADYVDHIRGVDLLVHECYFPDGFDDYAEKTGHSCLRQVVELAGRAGVGRLAIVHVNPLDPTASRLDLNGARTIFGNLFVPADLDVVDW